MTDVVLLDGGMGQELTRRSKDPAHPQWGAWVMMNEPEIVQGLHEDYIRAGSEIVISNTFATHREALRSAGVEDQFVDYNRRGVELAVEARARMDAPDVLVAGGISYWSWSGDWATAEELGPGVEEQAAIMADAGADLLMLEMMIDTERMLATLKAAQKSGLPVWAGLTCKRDDGGQAIMRNGDNLPEALVALAEHGVPLVSFMHTEVEYIDACLETAGEHWPGPLGVYAHSARWVNNVCFYDETVSPQEYASHAEVWLQNGVQVIGACCGLGVDHVSALKPLV